MKKAISILLVLIMTLSVCSVFTGCGSNSIELTLDNYEQYLDVRAYASIESEYEGNSFVIGRYGTYDDTTEDYGRNIYGNVYVEGLSPNFNYSDIKIEVEISGKYNHCDLSAHKSEIKSTLQWDDFELVAVCNKVDITGKGSSEGNDKIALPAGRGIPVLSYANGAIAYYWESDFLVDTYKVISVSGTVTPA